jgi:8-oxo-dGTP pyrophosphatase MutT (NUDIX family)
MPTRKEKVVAYITDGDRLLVFTQPYAPSDAGIQVPAGTIEHGEDPDVAVLREAFEESGLEELELVAFLGEREFDARPYGKDELHHRRFYHLRCTTKPPEEWEHEELDPHGGADHQIILAFRWVRFPDEVPQLIAGQDAFVNHLPRAPYRHRDHGHVGA